ncbi:SMAD/FHA domain-containing protein [Gorgonomyces haynaldii]|nr:SMAD/FHA domain-containing protein [Gorgonomyces haynaldii]
MYQKPDWSEKPVNEYYLEVLKNGSIIETVQIEKEYIVFGKLDDCDVVMEHPSISRHHCVLQFRANDRFLFDMSTHGTFLNKNRIPQHKFVKVKTGDMIKFGGSTRIYIFQGPEDPIEPVRKPKEEGIDWGFKEDAFDGDEWEGLDIEFGPIDRSEIPEDASYLQDPKKQLKQWIQNRGEEYEPQFVEKDGDCICRIELPVKTERGKLMAIGHGQNKKKAEKDACLEGCAKLDRMGVLDGGKRWRELQKRRLEDLEDDEDDFYDLTKNGTTNDPRKEAKNRPGVYKRPFAAEKD